MTVIDSSKPLESDWRAEVEKDALEQLGIVLTDEDLNRAKNRLEESKDV